MDFDVINEIYRDVNQMINEELGIADHVKNEVDSIYDLIIKNTETADRSIISDGTSARNGNFKIEFLNRELTIFFTLVNFKDYKYREEYREKYGNSYLDSSSRFFYRRTGKDKIVNLTSISVAMESINGTIQNVANIKDSIQHELEHIYQQTLMDKEFGNGNLYSIAVSNIYSSNDMERYLSNIIYMSFKSEIEGFSNGLYAFANDILKNGEMKINLIFSQSDAFKKLQLIYEARKYIIANFNSNELANALCKYKQYDINKNNIIRIADKTIQQMVGRFGKVLMKVKKDIKSEGIVMGGSDIHEMKFKPI